MFTRYAVLGAMSVGLALTAPALPAAAQQSAVDAQAKFVCGDPRLAQDEPCLPPNWCEGPNGTYPARLDNSCHVEDAENGPPPAEQQLADMRPRGPNIPQFRCQEGYAPVLVQGVEPACAGDLQPPLPMPMPPQLPQRQ